MAISAAPAEPVREPQSIAQHMGNADNSTQSRLASKDLISQGALGHAWKDVTDHNANEMPNWDVKQNMAEARQIEAERAKLSAAPVYAEQTSYKVSYRTVIRERFLSSLTVHFGTGCWQDEWTGRKKASVVRSAARCTFE